MHISIQGILQNVSTSSDENDAIDIEMQCDMLFILASLCDGETHRKVIYVVLRCSVFTCRVICSINSKTVCR